MLLSIGLSALILTDAMARRNARAYGMEMSRRQSFISQAQRSEMALRQLSLRVGDLAQKDSALRDILVRNKITVNPNESSKVDGKK